MRTFLFAPIIIAFICVSCDKILPGEHVTLAFENNSLDTVYVDGGLLTELDSYRPNNISIGLPKKDCEVPPGTINYDTSPLVGAGICYSYEYVFSRTKTAKTCLVYVVPFYSTEASGKPLYDYRLVCYELTIEDLVSLDFHLYYPPNEKMKNIKMEPPYSYFHSEDK